MTAIGELCAKHRLTFLVCTPTFLQLYQRRCTPEQFSTLRVVLTGAEKLPLRLCQSFEDRFGIGPIEGYGVTECAPVIAVNCPDFRAAGFFNRPPGVARSANRSPVCPFASSIPTPSHYSRPGHLACCS